MGQTSSSSRTKQNRVERNSLDAPSLADQVSAFLSMHSSGTSMGLPKKDSAEAETMLFEQLADALTTRWPVCSVAPCENLNAVYRAQVNDVQVQAAVALEQLAVWIEQLSLALDIPSGAAEARDSGLENTASASAVAGVCDLTTLAELNRFVLQHHHDHSSLVAMAQVTEKVMLLQQCYSILFKILQPHVEHSKVSLQVVKRSTQRIRILRMQLLQALLHPISPLLVHMMSEESSTRDALRDFVSSMTVMELQNCVGRAANYTRRYY